MTTDIIISQKSNVILSKIKHDLKYGIKLQGNHAQQLDVIRVWTKHDTKAFAISANSSRHYESDINFVEIESLSWPRGLRLAIFLADIGTDKKIETRFERITEQKEISTKETEEFAENYLKSYADLKEIKEQFDRLQYINQHYTWVTPGLVEEV